MKASSTGHKQRCVITLINCFHFLVHHLSGTNRNEDAHNAKVSLKSDSASNGSMHSNDEVFAHENGHPNERVETNQSVSNSVLVLVRFISSPFSDDRTRASLRMQCTYESIQPVIDVYQLLLVSCICIVSPVLSQKQQQQQQLCNKFHFYSVLIKSYTNWNLTCTNCTHTHTHITNV